MDNMLVSVVVPVYNVAQYLDACVESLQAQTWPALEILLVDDGSTDESPRMCDAYAARDSRIRVIHQQNRGLSEARNTGIQAAWGEYIAFVDSDDTVEKDMIAQLVRMLDGDTDISICSLASQENELDSGIAEETVSLTPAQAMEEIFRERLFSTSASGKLYRKSLFDTVRFPQGLYFEDYATIYRVFARARRLSFVHTRKYYYRYNPEGITKGAFKIKWMDYFTVSDQVRRYVEENQPELLPYIRQREVNYAVSFYRFACLSDYREKAVLNALLSRIRGAWRLYLRSGYARSKKISALVIAVCPGLARMILKRS